MWMGPRYLLPTLLYCSLLVIGSATEGAAYKDVSGGSSHSNSGGGRHPNSPHHSSSAEVQAGCWKRRIVHTIKSANCIPRRLLSYACQGWCSSYTQISSGSLEFKRHCKCCQEMGERTARVRVRCRDLKSGGRGGFRLYPMLLKVPGGCMCRPCSQEDPNVIVPLELAELETKRTG